MSYNLPRLGGSPTKSPFQADSSRCGERIAPVESHLLQAAVDATLKIVDHSDESPTANTTDDSPAATARY
jgi:hypothetical protein